MIPTTKSSFLVFSVLVAACGNHSTDSAPARRLSADEMAQVIVAEMRQFGSQPSRCAPSGSADAGLLVVVSEDVCVGCINLGWFIREFRRTTHRNVTVVAAAGIENVACEFIVRHKTGAALALVRDTVLVPWQPSRRPVVIDIAADGSIRGAHSSSDLPGLLRLVETN